MDLVHQLTCGQISGFFGGRTDPWLLQFHDVLRPSCRVALTTALEVKDGKTVRKLLKGEAGSMDWVASLQNADGICHWDVLDGFYGLLKRMRWNHPFRIHCVRCWRCWRLAVWILPQASPDSGVELSLIRRTWRVSCWTLLGTLIFLCLCVCFKSVELILKKTYIYIYIWVFLHFHFPQGFLPCVGDETSGTVDLSPVPWHQEGWVTSQGNAGSSFLSNCRKPYMCCEEESFGVNVRFF